MAVAMPSRFAVLKLEDDDFKPQNPNKNNNKQDKKKTTDIKSKKNNEKSQNESHKKATKVSTHFTCSYLFILN